MVARPIVPGVGGSRTSSSVGVEDEEEDAGQPVRDDGLFWAFACGTFLLQCALWRFLWPRPCLA